MMSVLARLLGSIITAGFYTTIIAGVLAFGVSVPAVAFAVTAVAAALLCIGLIWTTP
jgi:hypothetical protein